jgi:pimeloyl-ACP methyl ester carboxylesterase
MPAKNPGAWRDDLVAAAYIQRALHLDPASDLHTPAKVRIPNGPLAEICGGTAMWDAARITTPTLIVRGERAPTSVVAVPGAEEVSLKGATHYLLLDKPEHGRKQFMARVARFLARN